MCKIKEFNSLACSYEPRNFAEYSTCETLLLDVLYFAINTINNKYLSYLFCYNIFILLTFYNNCRYGKLFFGYIYCTTLY